MTDAITATELRRNVYRILDEVLDSGAPRYISRRGKLLVLVEATPSRPRFGSGPQRQTATVSIDELAAISWEHAWEPDTAR